jgi:hypothetical protein
MTYGPNEQTSKQPPQKKSLSRYREVTAGSSAADAQELLTVRRYGILAESTDTN